MKNIFVVFFLLSSLLQAETRSTTVNDTQFDVRFFDGVVCDDKGILGLNNLGQILYREDEALIVFDSNTESRLDLSHYIDSDLFIYCPPKSRCLNDAGEVIGMIDQSVVKWAPSTGLQTYPLPEDLRKNHWTKVQRLEFVADNKILLGLGSNHSSERKYYLLQDGEFVYLNQYLQENCFPESELADLKISHLRFNAHGHIAGVVEIGHPLTQENVQIFLWDGAQTYLLSLKDFIKRENYIPDSLDVFALSDNGDVTVYFSDYKSIYIDYTTKKYMVWHPQTGTFEQILSGKDLGFGVINGKGNGIFTRQQNERNILFNGHVFQLDKILSYCGLEDLHKIDYYSFVNENDDIVITTSEKGQKKPFFISLREIPQ